VPAVSEALAAGVLEAPRPQVLPLAEALARVGARGRIGLVVLATDVNSETELRRMAPPGVEIFTNRIENVNPVSIANLRAIAGDVTRAARGILPGNRIDAMVFGCTSGTIAIGEAEVTRLIRAARPGIPCTNPIAATLAALAVLGAQRISVLTPYTVPVNQAIAAYLCAKGLEVLSIAGFDLDQDDDMTAVTPAATLAAAVKCCHPAADLLFVSCTALRVADVLHEMEERLARPVIASNQALLWHALRLIGNDDPLAGFGRLLTLPLAGSAGER
jgi:maleate isomerase